MNIERIIQQTAIATANEFFKRIKLQKKGCDLGSYERTEMILYEYPYLNKTILGKDSNKYIERVQAALDSIKDDPYSQIIELKYFQKWTHERIAEFYDVDVSVISKHRKKLINKIRPQFFPEIFVKELFEEVER